MAKVLVSVAVTLFLLGEPAFGLTDFSAVVDRVRSQSVDQVKETGFVVLTKTASGILRQQYVLRRSTTTEGGFQVEGSNTQVSVLQKFNKDGTLTSIMQNDSSRGLGLSQAVDKARRTVRTKVTEDGKVKSEKTTVIDGPFVLQAEINNVVAQAWKAGIRDGLLLKSLSPDGGMVGDFQIEFRETDNPLSLSSKYDYPEEFRKAIPKASYVVADMSLLGIGSFFFPHHFYLAYRKGTSSLEFVAYYGENPKTAVFQFSAPM